MPNLDGLPTAAQILLETDQLASLFKAQWPVYGLGPSSGVGSTDVNGQSNTMAVKGDVVRTTILGDGTTTYPGLGSPAQSQAISGSLTSLYNNLRVDTFWKKNGQTLVQQLDRWVSSNIPSTWSFSNRNNGHKFDLWLQYLNALTTGTPATPGAAGVITAVNNASGQLPMNTASGSCPFVCHCLVGASDWLTSQHSAEATRVALVGTQNAYSYQIAGTVPVGTTKVRIMRGLFGGSTGGPYYFSQDVEVTAGASYPAILILTPDNSLNRFVQPPVFGSCLLAPEFATIFALPWSSTASDGTGLKFSSGGMLSPQNIFLPPATEFQGLGNPLASSVLDTVTITGATTFTQVAGAPYVTNVAGSNIQGYLGATGIRARVTTVLNGTLLTLTISYTYLDITNGAVVQTGGVLVSGASSGTAVGSIAAFTLPANTILLSCTVTAKTGTSTSGAVVIEPTTRAY